MNVEAIVGILLILYGINIAYKASIHHYPFNKERWYSYQFKDYYRAFLVLLLGFILIFGKLKLKELFE